MWNVYCIIGWSIELAPCDLSTRDGLLMNGDRAIITYKKSTTSRDKCWSHDNIMKQDTTITLENLSYNCVNTKN